MKGIILTRETPGLAEYDLEAPEKRYPASILQGNRMSDADLLKIVQEKFAREASALKPEEMYFFAAEISNQSLDSYFTKMAKSSLANYAEDARNGVAFQNSHKSRELGVGYVINGEFDEEALKVVADAYTVRGLKLNADLGTDDFIKGIETGMIRDVSIGFKGGPDYAETCSLCHNDFWSYECRHIPGMTYEVADDPNADPTDQNTNEQMAFVWIENARLSEVSAVYDGATPGAMILTKARREERAGRLTSQVRSMIQQRFHIDLHEPRRTFAGSGRPNDGERPDSNFEEERSNEMADEKLLERALTAEGAARIAEGKATEAENKQRDAETKLTTETTRAETAEARVKELETAIRSGATGIEGIEVKDDSKPEDLVRSIRTALDDAAPKAAQVDDLRNAEIEKALDSGARAYGEDFDKDKRTETLKKLTLPEIAEIGNEWEARAVASGKFPTGRVSKEEGEDEPDENASRGNNNHSVPSASFNRL